MRGGGATMTSTALDPALVRQLADWLASTAAGTAWLTGSPGSGMTTMVREVTRDMEAVWLIPATLRSRQFLKEVCSHPLAVTGRRKVLVLDELDVLLGNEAAMADVAWVVKHNACVPVVCILKASRAAATCDLAKKASVVVHFPPPTHEAMVAAVVTVARAEGLDTGRVESLCRAAPGDVRHVVQTLRAAARTTRDVTMPTADAVAEVLGGPCDFRRAMALFSADSGGLPAGLFEAYTQAADLDPCAEYADLVSAADVVDDRMHARHWWDLLDVYGALTTAGAALLLPRAPTVRLAKYGTVWNKSYMQCTKAKALKAVQATRAAAGRAALGAEDLALVRGMLGEAVRESAADAAELARGAGLDAPACLHLMRLWDSGYKLSAHARLKKALAAAGES